MTLSLRTALAGGNSAAVSDLMATHHGFAVLLAEAVGAHTATATVLERAWVDTVAAVVADAGTPLRASLLGAVLRLLRDDGHLDETQAGTDSAAPPRAGFFLPPGDRWAGWWDVDVPSWPAGRVPTAEQVLHAVRRLPLRQRTLLILRDSARLSANETADIVGVEPDDQGRLLDGAREAYVAYLDEEVRAGDVGVPNAVAADILGAPAVKGCGVGGGGGQG